MKSPLPFILPQLLLKKWYMKQNIQFHFHRISLRYYFNYLDHIFCSQSCCNNCMEYTIYDSDAVQHMVCGLTIFIYSFNIFYLN